MRRESIEMLLHSEQKYRDLTESNLDGYMRTNMDGFIIETSMVFRQMVGYSSEELKEMTFRDLTPEKWHQLEDNIILGIIQNGHSPLYQKECRKKDGTIFPVELRGYASKDPEGNVTSIWAFIRDITEYLAIVDRVFSSERSLATAQRIAHLGNWDWEIQTNTLLWSDEVYRIFGLMPGGIHPTYNIFLQHIHPDDRGFVSSCLWDALIDLRPFKFEHRIINSDNAIRYVQQEGEVCLGSSGEPLRMVGILYDTTERKHTEDELRTLSRKLLDVQENERRTLGRELHDEIGQSLTVLTILLETAMQSPSVDAVICLTDAKALTQDLMSRVRDMSLDLRPAMLDDLGLLPTLLWYTQRYIDRTKIEIDFKHRGLKRYIPQDISTAVFRIWQESLTNVARHSGASEVKIRAWIEHGTLLLTVEDRGNGFDPIYGAGVSSGGGLINMDERARLVGGKLIVETNPGMGTRVSAELPLKILSEDYPEEDKVDNYCTGG